jgi:hypothetical protein
MPVIEPYGYEAVGAPRNTRLVTRDVDRCLSGDEIDAIVAFLGTLTDRSLPGR